MRQTTMTTTKSKITQHRYLELADLIIESKILSDDQKMIELLDLAASVEIEK
jgi:hypothetical protein